MMKGCRQHCICTIGAKEYRPSTFVILLNCSNLAVILFLTATAKQAVVILFSQQHKCATVGCHNFDESQTRKIKMRLPKFYVRCLYITILLSCNNNSTMEKKYDELTDKDYEHKSDTVDGEAIYFKTATSANTPQDFTNLDTSQKLFIKHCLEGADSIIKRHQPNSDIDNFYS